MAVVTTVVTPVAAIVAVVTTVVAPIAALVAVVATLVAAVGLVGLPARLAGLVFTVGGGSRDSEGCGGGEDSSEEREELHGEYVGKVDV